MIQKMMLLAGTVVMWAAVTAGGFLQAQSLATPQTTIIVDGAESAVGDFVSMAIGSNGFPIMSYYDEDSDDLKLAVCHDQLCSNPTITVVDSSTNDVGRWNSMQLNSSGHPVISYWDVSLGDVKLVVCGNVSCTAGNVYRTIDSTSNSGEFTMLVLNSIGNPVVTYHQGGGGILKLAVCSDSTCLITPTIQTILSNPSSMGDMSIVLNDNNIPHLAIRNGFNLGIVLCHNATCSTHTYRQIDDNAGFYSTAIVLGENDHPIVSYYADSSLKLALCESATDCQTPTLRTIDNVGDTGRRKFFTLNDQGLPIFSYYNTTGAFFMARCSDATCETPAQITQLGNSAEGGKTAIRQVGNTFFAAYHTSNTQDLVLVVETLGVTNNDTFTVMENSLNNQLAVLENDEGDLSLFAVGTPNNGGSVTISNTGLVYTPAVDFLGTEVFTYTAEDSLGEFDTAAVTVTVTPPNQAPLAQNDTYTITQNSPNNLFDVLENDQDANKDSLFISDLGTPDNGGSVTISNTAVVYTPSVDFSGTEVFTYTAGDGNGGFDTAIVTVTVTPNITYPLYLPIMYRPEAAPTTSATVNHYKVSR